MTMTLRSLAVVAGLAVGGAVAAAPAPTTHRPRPGVNDMVADLRARPLARHDLVDAAIVEVSAAFEYHSVWHLWESPGAALANGRGWSHQYNSVLADVLKRLGFGVRLVHAARVQGSRHPWFFASHAWVKVEVDGRWLDACASRSTNRLDETWFVPVSEELPFRPSTRFTVPLGLMPFVTVEAWRSLLLRRPVPSWMYRRRD